MVQISPCLIGTAFLVAMLATSVAKPKNVFQDLEKALNKQEMWVYEQARSERMGLYMTGLMIGTFLGLVALKQLVGTYNPLLHGCLFATIVMTTCFFYYMLMPKQYKVIEQLNDAYKRQVWQKVYRTMQTRYWGGFLLGIIGFLVLGYGLTSSGADVGDMA